MKTKIEQTEFLSGEQLDQLELNALESGKGKIVIKEPDGTIIIIPV